MRKKSRFEKMDRVSCMINGFNLGRKVDDLYDAINAQTLVENSYNRIMLLANSLGAVGEAAKDIRDCNGSTIPQKIVDDSIEWREHINHMLGMGITKQEHSELIDSLLDWRREIIYDIKTMGDE